MRFSPRQPFSGHHLFLALALLLAAGVAVLGVVSFERKVDAFQPLGFEAVAEGGAWRVTAVTEPETGLLPGDAVILVAGQPAADRGHLEGLLRERPESELLVKRGDEVAPVTYRRPALDVDFPYLILTLIGLAYLLIGLYTAVKDRQGQARLFCLWGLASAALFLLSPRLPPADLLDRLVHLADQLARTLLPALTVHLFLDFPAPLFARRLRRRALALLYLPSLVLGAFHLDAMFAGGRLFGPVTAVKVQLVDRLELYLLVFCVFLAALTLVARFAHQPGWEERRQVQWILFGLCGGYLPFLFLYVAPLSLGWSWPAWTTVAAVLPLGLVPIAFAWAILKYKLLDLGIILRNTVSYGLTAVVALFGFSLLNLAIRSGVAEELQTARNLLTFAAGLAIAGVLAPTKNAITSGLERLQYRGSHDQRQMLSELGHELLHVRDLDHLCHTLIDELGDGLVARVNLYLAQGGAMVPVAPAPGLPRELPFDAFGAELWRRDSVAISALHLPAAETSPQQRLFTAGYRYAFPLTVRDHRVGIALASYKYDEEPLNSEDVDLVRGVLNQAALAIENAQLLEEVNRQLHEVVRLEAYSKGILEHTPAGIAVLDDDDRVLSANHAFAAIAGVARPRLEGRLVTELLPARPLPTTGEGLREVSFCEMSGEERHLQLSTASYPREEGEQRILIVQDVSERVAMEMELQEKERLASLGMLAAGVAHEVNTPLTGISSYAQLLLADVDEDDPRYEILKKMERQTFRAAQIVNNLLEFTRNRRAELAAVAIDGVIDECVELLSDRAAASEVEIRWRRPETPVMVSGHEGELHQVVTNLVVNAIDALASDGEEPPRRIGIAVEATDLKVRVEVSDNGPGIPSERLETIFRPFFSSKLSKGGSGLGLAITYNIVRRHGGELRVENHHDTPGCTFTVELPRDETIH